MRNKNSFLEKCVERRVEKGIYRAIFALMHLIVGAAIFAAVGYGVMLLWNWLIPGIIGWTVISYWQALGLLTLSKLLFGGFIGGKHNFGMGFRHLHNHHNPMREKWQKMTPEERKDFINKMRCGQTFFQQKENEEPAAK
ncbi:MAG: hypothetical protein LBN27_09130 [Prevotellaceae bacterium]|jgi:hypothetical protein|nr:hypothetical protein [Prevotellaceae bacterium]